MWRMENQEVEDFGLKPCSESAGVGTRSQEPFGENGTAQSPARHTEPFVPCSFSCLFPFPPAQHPLLLLARTATSKCPDRAHRCPAQHRGRSCRHRAGPHRTGAVGLRGDKANPPRRQSAVASASATAKGPVCVQLTGRSGSVFSRPALTTLPGRVQACSGKAIALMSHVRVSGQPLGTLRFS